jgi:hypothetical protein
MHHPSSNSVSPNARPKSLQHKRGLSFKLQGQLDIAGAFEAGGVQSLASPRRQSVNSKPKFSDEWYAELEALMRGGMPLSDHKHLLRTHKNTFTGEACVAFLRGCGRAAGTPAALEIMNSLMSSGVLKCIDGTKEAKCDSAHIYSIRDEVTAPGLSGGEKSRSNTETDINTDTYENLSFHEVLDHPTALLKFERFCVKEFNTENLHFYTSILEYRDQLEDIQKTINETAQKVIDHYIKAGAIEQVNIPATMREDILTKFKSGATAHLFDRAAEEIHGIMKKDTHPRFSRSEMAQAQAKKEGAAAAPAK